MRLYDETEKREDIQKQDQTRSIDTQTFAVDPLGIDVGVGSLVEGDLVRAVHVFDFEKAAAATASVGCCCWVSVIPIAVVAWV